LSVKYSGVAMRSRMRAEFAKQRSQAIARRMQEFVSGAR
jgi:hypothetical protein